MSDVFDLLKAHEGKLFYVRESADESTLVLTFRTQGHRDARHVAVTTDMVGEIVGYDAKPGSPVLVELDRDDGGEWSRTRWYRVKT